MLTVPWCSIMVRRSFGVAQVAHYGPEGEVYAWPSRRSRDPCRSRAASPSPFTAKSPQPPIRHARRRELEEMLAAKQSMFPRAEAFSIHELIDPRETRPMICRWIDRVQPLLPALVGPSSFTIRP